MEKLDSLNNMSQFPAAAGSLFREDFGTNTNSLYELLAIRCPNLIDLSVDLDRLPVDQLESWKKLFNIPYYLMNLEEITKLQAIYGSFQLKIGQYFKPDQCRSSRKTDRTYHTTQGKDSGHQASIQKQSRRKSNVKRTRR